MAKKRVFISFDYHNDASLRDSLVEQSRRPDSPFSMVDCSVRAPYDEQWKRKVRRIVRDVDLVIVICGERTDMADGVAAELSIVHEEGKRYFLLRGHPKRHCSKPRNALRTDEIHEWNWRDLHNLIYAGR